MKFILWWWHGTGTEGIEDAKQKDAAAEQRLREAKDTGRWVDRTLKVNNLTARFYQDLRRGGHA